ncbi:hypothetical protein NEHOM01_1064 [Nematocida homosporus]|uniref:uncharacterized protein n=1 Tax=Nematocida homosporus TaxID=1912981 RepID=UPI00221FA642|nr:uncharacterized protein NEHOM01_1064 [Nematocida homosporus]KAI5185787.1 hypothetical protein NEHOM01_1064 [Nematocida homosporus]
MALKTSKIIKIGVWVLAIVVVTSVVYMGVTFYINVHRPKVIYNENLRKAESVFEWVCAQTSLARSDLATKNFVLSIIQNSYNEQPEEKVAGAEKLLASSIGFFMFLSSDALSLAEQEGYDALWVRIILHGIKLYAWKLATLEAHVIKELVNKHNEFYRKQATENNQGTSNSNNQKKPSFPLAKEIILVIAAHNNFGGFTERCQALYNRLYKYPWARDYHKHYQLNLPIMDLLFNIDLLSYLVPLSLKQRQNISSILDEVDNILFKLEQSTTTITSTISNHHFSNPVQSLLNELTQCINCMLTIATAMRAAAYYTQQEAANDLSDTTTFPIELYYTTTQSLTVEHGLNSYIIIPILMTYTKTIDLYVNRKHCDVFYHLFPTS